MPRVLICSDDGEVIWNEGVHACDFEGEHFRRCLVGRLGWAVADAESTWRLATVQPVRVEAARRPLKQRSPVEPPMGAAA
jgi:hypothetical protein